MTGQYEYPYDPTGKNPECRVTDKSHPVVPVQGSGHSLIVPKAGPFFKEGFTLVHTDTGRELKEGKDFVFTHYVLDLAHRIKEHLYASITIVNPQVIGSVKPEYQTIGDSYAFNEETLADAALFFMDANGAYSWRDLKDKPTEFPPEDHELPAPTTGSYEDLIEAVMGISFGADHTHDIHNIRHLDDILRSKMDVGGNYKVLTDKHLRIDKEHLGSVAVRLPKVRTRCQVKVRIQIVEVGGVYELELTGRVHQYNDGSLPERWDNWHITPSYKCWHGLVYMTYDSEHYPVVILGKDRQWLDTSVTILDYFTEDSYSLEEDKLPFRVSLSRSYEGIEYIDTSKIGVILTPSKGDAELTELINSKYYGVLPEGIYNGYELSLNQYGQIQVGDPTSLSSAVIYNGLTVASVVLDKQAQLLTVTEPTVGKIVLRLLKELREGDDRFFVDVPGHGADIAILPDNQVKEGMLILGTVNYPDNSVDFGPAHVSDDGRQTAKLGGGLFGPIQVN